MITKKPTLIKGDSSFDNRGSLSFINDLNLKDIKRYYLVKNYKSQMIRAWHAHKNEFKIIICIKGSFQVSAVRVTNFKNPSKEMKVYNFFINENKSECVFIPKKFANGLMSLEDKSELIIFSNVLLDKSLKDDYRFKYDYWNPWIILNR